MRLAGSVYFALLCALAVIAGPRTTRACEPTSDVFEAWPADGPLPINAFAVFVGAHIHDSPNLFTVLIDGQPVEFIVSQQLSGEGLPFDQIALRPLDPPSIGASWSVKFNGDVVGTFTVAAADHTPPAAPPASLHFDVDDFFSSQCSSCGNSAVNYWLHHADGAEDGGAPLVHALYVGHPDAADDQLFEVRRVGPQPPNRVTLPDSWFADNVPVTEGVCVTLRLLDLAGNEAASALRTCKPCHARIDPMQEPCFGAPVLEEPAWTDADLFPGGACQAESAPPLPPEGFPEPDPGTTGDGSETDGDATTGTATTDGAGTGTTTTDTTTTGTTTTGDTTAVPPTSATTTAGTGEEPTSSPSGSSTLDPTTAGPGDPTTPGGSSSESSDTAAADPDKAGCGCRGAPSSPVGLGLLLLAGLRRRSSRQSLRAADPRGIRRGLPLRSSRRRRGSPRPCVRTPLTPSSEGVSRSPCTAISATTRPLAIERTSTVDTASLSARRPCTRAPWIVLMARIVPGSPVGLRLRGVPTTYPRGHTPSTPHRYAVQVRAVA